jgi:hypothetical protein
MTPFHFFPLLLPLPRGADDAAQKRATISQKKKRMKRRVPRHYDLQSWQSASKPARPVVT